MSASIEFVNIENFSLDMVDRKVLNDTYNTIVDEQEISLEEAKTKLQEVADEFTEYGFVCRGHVMFGYFRNLISDAGLVVDEKYTGGWDSSVINITKIKTKKE